MTQTDTGIMLGILFAFFLLGFSLPFIHDAFGEAQTNVNAGGILFQSGQGFSQNETSILEVIVSIFTIFFFTFGAVPIAIDIVILFPIRIILVWLLFRQIRGIGG